MKKLRYLEPNTPMPVRQQQRKVMKREFMIGAVRFPGQASVCVRSCPGEAQNGGEASRDLAEIHLQRSPGIDPGGSMS